MLQFVTVDDSIGQEGSGRLLRQQFSLGNGPRAAAATLTRGESLAAEW